MTAIRAVLFDKDGTLFDFQASWGAWTTGLITDLCGPDPARQAHLADALGFDATAVRFLPHSPVIAGTVADVARIVAGALPDLSGDLDALAQDLGRRAEGITPIPAVPLAPLLTRLRTGGYRLGVATNDAERAARVHLAAVVDQFDFIAGYDSGHGAKPEPEMLLAFARACALTPRQVLMVGDSTHDLLAGRAAGMGTVAVLTGVAEARDLAPFADHVVPDIGHLPRLLGLEPQGG